MPIYAPKFRFLGVWNPKNNWSSSRPPKGTSAPETTYNERAYAWSYIVQWRWLRIGIMFAGFFRFDAVTFVIPTVTFGAPLIFCVILLILQHLRFRKFKHQTHGIEPDLLELFCRATGFWFFNQSVWDFLSWLYQICCHWSLIIQSEPKECTHKVTSTH